MRGSQKHSPLANDRAGRNGIRVGSCRPGGTKCPTCVRTTGLLQPFGGSEPRLIVTLRRDFPLLAEILSSEVLATCAGSIVAQ